MTATLATAPAHDRPARLTALRARLAPPLPAAEIWGWVGPLLVTALGAYLRFNRLSVPRTIIFDETYYVPDAYGILHFGVEHNYVSNRNALITHGNTHIFTSGGEFVVHPPLGKLMIAVGEWLFGLTPFGWRFTVAVVGSLSILLLARITRRMTRSTLLGCVAGFLLALDGLELVMSRTALLDIFVMFWVLAAFGCLVVDRDQARLRLADLAAAGPAAHGGPKLGIRWWRVAAGVCLGLACASKWDGIWYILVFGLMCVAWDIGARRAAGVTGPVAGALARDTSWLPLTFGVVPFAVYLASWSGWFATGTGYDRTWAAQHGIHTPVISQLVSLYQYHLAMLGFNVGLHAHHPYQSQPWTWLTMNRPVAFFWVCPTTGHGQCSAGRAQEVLALGTPVIWWASIAALLVCLGWWLTRRDWRAGAVLAGVVGGWLPWFLFVSRTKFYFYSVAFVPFLIIGITLCLGLIIGPAGASARRRAIGAAVAGAYLLGVLADFAYLYPILTAQAIQYGSWLNRMWYHGWI
ncbi:MAG: dolichyl-phosphate-mannose--protein mannosyltransferase [Gemmatimonadota bacterium]